MINNEILKTILQEYSIKRNAKIFACENLKNELYKDNEFEQIDKQMRELIFEKGKLQFEKKDTSKIIESLQALQYKKMVILEKHNLKISDLSPNYDCKFCKDTGFVENEMCCCLKQAYNNQLMKNSNINFENIDELEKMNFSSLNKQNQEQLNLLKDKLIDFCNNFDNCKIKNIVFVGKTGVGKTYFSQSVAKKLISKNNTVLFSTSFNLNNKFLETHLSRDTNKPKQLEQFLLPDLLIIDDLGTEPILKNITTEYLLLLINERNLLNKKTIITTNLMPNNILDKYGERIFSRIFNKSCSLLFLIEGSDLRLNAKA